MRRREFIAGLGSVAAWPVVARAQQPALPVVGYLDIGVAETRRDQLTAFRHGLNEAGFVEGRNVTFEFRWADSQYERMPALTDDLFRRQVAVVFAFGAPAVQAAKARTATVPIVFFIGEDPVKEGFVTSLNRPGGNVTGVTNFQNQLYGKQLGLLREIAPKATAFASLVDPNNPNAEPDSAEIRAAANAIGLELRVLTARDDVELESAFVAMSHQTFGGVVIGVANFGVLPEQLVSLAARHPLPAIYHRREYPVAGGLMSYGTSRVDALRQAGLYVGRVLKGEKPADLPVMQPTKFELVINLKTAQSLGLTIPETLLATADEVIQ
jgi:putative ABC transport system substrate-binding protein